MTTRNPTWVAEDYRLYNDTGAAGSSAIAGQNTAGSVPNGNKFRLRVAVGETNNATTANVGSWQLQFSINGGSFTTVGAATTVKYVTSDAAEFVDPNTLTQALGGVTGSAAYQSTWSEQCENGSVASQTWTDDDTEYEYCLQLNGTSVSDVVTFRMLSPSSATAVTFTNVPTVNVQAATQTLTQSSRFDNSQSFHAPTVAPGAVTLTQASRFDNSASFYGPTVAAGAVTLTANLFTSATEAFYSPIVAQSGGPQSLTQDTRPDNAQSFYGATVAAGSVTLTANRLDNEASFYAHTVSAGGVTLTPDRFDNTASFYAATVSQGTITLSPPRVDNSPSFYAATVTPGGVTLTPARYDSSQSFYGPTVSGDDVLGPPLFSNTVTFYGPTVQNQYPDPSTVAVGINYGDGAVQFTGTMSAVYTGAMKIDVSTGRLVKIISDKVALSL